MSFGFILRYILNEINIELEGSNDFMVHKFQKVKELKAELNDFSFYTLEEYKDSLINLHIKISKYYKEQDIKNFNNIFSIINTTKYRKYSNELKLFEDIEFNNYLIRKDNEIVDILNEILLSNDYYYINLFSYFISGFIYVLNKYGIKYQNDTDLLKTRMNMSLKDLKKLDEIANKKENKDKIITFNTFLTNVINIESLGGKIKEFFNFKNFFKSIWKEKFDTIIYINYNFEKDWKFLCFNSNIIMTFNLFTFFKVNDVKINFEEKCAEISLETVGKREIFEEKFYYYNAQDYNVYYNEKDNIIEILRQNTSNN